MSSEQFRALRELLPTQQRSAMLATAVGTGYSLLRFRLLPVWAMRSWFLCTVLCTVFPASAVLYLVDLLRYLGVPRRWVQHLCVFIMVVSFKLAWWLNPQIRMKLQFDAGEDDSLKSWNDVETERIALALNHTSFWDVFEMIGLTPVSRLLRMRTLMKSSLRNIPIFGGCFDRVGHFPVYFKSDEDGNFHVDKERQAVVQKDVDEHLVRGGSLAIFPEGAVNKHPEKLQAFRFGTFATIFEHRLPLYYMVSVGNEKTWPATAALGGMPADITVRVGRYPINFDTQESKQVAQEMQVKMQQVYDDIVEEGKKKKNN